MAQMRELHPGALRFRRNANLRATRHAPLQGAATETGQAAIFQSIIDNSKTLVGNDSRSRTGTGETRNRSCLKCFQPPLPGFTKRPPMGRWSRRLNCQQFEFNSGTTFSSQMQFLNEISGQVSSIKRLKGMTWDHSRGFDPMVFASRWYSEINPGIEIAWEKRSLQAFADHPIREMTNDYGEHKISGGTRCVCERYRALA